MTKKTDWHVIGNICIDTGTLLLCDPCNADKAEMDIFDEEQRNEHGCPSVKDEYGNGYDVALAVETGLGDGLYPVSVRYEDVPNFGERVAEVRITFLPHPQFQLTDYIKEN